MGVLFGPSYRVALGNRLGTANQSLVVFSAYVKTVGLQWLSDNLSGKDVSVAIVTRWQPQDLLGGASDIEAYEFARHRGWLFGISSRLHSKLFLVDHATLFLGSANLTSHGLHLNGIGNDEAGMEAQATEEDRVRIGNYLEQSVWINDQTYEALKAALSVVPEKEQAPSSEWPQHVRVLLEPPPTYLYVNEFFFSTPAQLLQGKSTGDVLHDLGLLGIAELSSLRPMELESVVRQGVGRMTAWRWVTHVVASAGEHGVRFGDLSARMHNALADDPKPYRKDVKGLVANLFEWVEWMDADMAVDTHAHTRSLRLK